jgi:hypothetical protein
MVVMESPFAWRLQEPFPHLLETCLMRGMILQSRGVWAKAILQSGERLSAQAR